MTRLFHYTHLAHLREITKCGYIKPSTLHVPPNEKAATWLSTNPDWEETVRARIVKPFERLVSRDEMLRAGLVPARIEVRSDYPCLDWAAFKRESGISREDARRLKIKGRRWGADPAEWRAVFSSIYAEDWVGIGLWNGKWEDMQIMQNPLSEVH